MFSPDQLRQAAVDLYGVDTLRNRVFPDAPTTDDADGELMRIARTVISRVAAACASGPGWPLPGKWPAGSTDLLGNDISGTPYADIWPDELLHRALDLFNLRTFGAYEGDISQKIRDDGAAAEKFFVLVARGVMGLGTGAATDVSQMTPTAARDRQGRNLVTDGAADHPRMIDTFRGRGWDWY